MFWNWHEVHRVQVHTVCTTQIDKDKEVNFIEYIFNNVATLLVNVMNGCNPVATQLCPPSLHPTP